MGSKTKQVKGAGSQSFPAPAHTAPQCGPRNDFHRGQFLPFGVSFWVMQRGKTSLTAEKVKSEAELQPELDYVNTFESIKKGLDSV
jgi:hypothetical protein